MREHIEGFIGQLEDAFLKGEQANFSIPEKRFNNVLILGVGGSGIGGTVVEKTALLGAGIPVMTCNDYHIPEYVNENTLVIACSYSGNTEETLTALKKCQNKRAEIAAVTSGGELKRICEDNNYNHIIIPGGNPPRTCLGYSLTEQIFILVKYDILPTNYLDNLRAAIDLLKINNNNIINEAEGVAQKLFGKIPVIYSTDKFEPVSIRFRQQLNENNYNDLLAPNSYTIGLATYDGADFTLTGETALLNKTQYNENPVYKAEILTVNGNKIGYLMYNGFIKDYDTELNNAFAQFKADGVSSLVLDLRYNGGGSVETATDLASMITGQFNGQVFYQEFWNEDRQADYAENGLFDSTISNGSSISSLNLSQVYIITTRRSASASELVLNGL